MDKDIVGVTQFQRAPLNALGSLGPAKIALFCLQHSGDRHFHDIAMSGQNDFYLGTHAGL